MTFRRSSKGGLSPEGPPGDEYVIDDGLASDDEDYHLGDEDEDEEEDDEEGVLSVASSVPTTEASATDHRSTASAKALRKEAQRIFSAKLMVIGIFLLVTIAVSVSVYGFANQEQNGSFESEVEGHAGQLSQGARLRMGELMRQLGSLSVSFSAMAIAESSSSASTSSTSSTSWPFVTLSNFEGQASHFLKQHTATRSLELSVVVSNDDRELWETYVINKSAVWITESTQFLGIPFEPETSDVSPFVYEFEQENGTVVEATMLVDYYAPIWMKSLATTTRTSVVVAPQSTVKQLLEWINFNTLNDTTFASIEQFFLEEAAAVSTDPTLTSFPVVTTPPMLMTTIMSSSQDHGDTTAYSTVEENGMSEMNVESTDDESNWPRSIFATPVFDTLVYDEASVASSSSSRTRVATLTTQASWHSFFENVLEDGILQGGTLVLAVENTCGDSYMYEITGSNVTYMGSSRHPILPSNGDELDFMTTLDEIPLTGECSIILHVAPSETLSESYGTNQPVIYTVAVLGIFAVMGIFFWFYDRVTGNSYSAAISKVERSKNLVESLFPSNVRARLLMDNKSTRSDAGGGSRSGNHSSHHEDDDGDLEDFLQKSRHGLHSKPIADLHPSVTVLFADIANFTAWASVREPTQVFLLLETLYHSFDKLCRRYKIFKVETIGDCYVAVAGLPEFVEDHAINMARFAQEIMVQMHKIVKQLEVALGPETGDLAMRIGMHSGPVTAGVLRGEKSRFQLFGDTVNTASRMESTGARNRIQVSSDAADQIEKWGKPDWLVPREDKVSVKGKGDMKTFWLFVTDIIIDSSDNLMSPGFATPGQSLRGKVRRSTILAQDKLNDLDLSNRSSSAEQLSVATPSIASPEEKKERLVNWSADLLLGLLKRIVAMRDSEESLNELKEFQSIVKGLDEMGGLSTRVSMNIDGVPRQKNSREPTTKQEPGKTVLDEVAEIIHLPRKANRYQQDPNNVDLGEAVVKQLYRFVREIARMYRDNPFHNFDHASHVTQSLTKLLSRVVAPDEVDYENMKYKKKAATSKLHKFTFGITSDPITQFACAFSSLIHDLDHPGVPNAVLVSEETAIAKHYRNKSVAEQNSVDLAWSLLMDPRFKDLRQCIYRNQSELDRFRQLVVNSVMATDIVDKELGQLRKDRWNRAFNKDPESELDEKATDEVNRKATIVIEHLIQAADVAHTMQHWHVYLKWNERFFHECYAVYLSGRSKTDPSEGWYKGEIGFFDFYIIPLAKKLESCGVFGVSSDECLQYAQANRDEWERKGEEIVKKYLSIYRK